MIQRPDCPCKRKKCVRYGNCVACRAYHAESKQKQPVYCERKKPLETISQIKNGMKKKESSLKCNIRRLIQDEYKDAVKLAIDVFMEYDAPDYDEEGVTEFHKSIQDDGYLAQLTIYGAYWGQELAGILATRNQGMHIALFFVKGEYQGNGIGRLLFEEALRNCTSKKITVNASPYAVSIYHALGFSDISKEQTVNGLRFTPMKYTVKEG